MRSSGVSPATRLASRPLARPGTGRWGAHQGAADGLKSHSKVFGSPCTVAHVVAYLVASSYPRTRLVSLREFCAGSRRRPPRTPALLRPEGPQQRRADRHHAGEPEYTPFGTGSRLDRAARPHLESGDRVRYHQDHARSRRTSTQRLPHRTRSVDLAARRLGWLGDGAEGREPYPPGSGSRLTQLPNPTALCCGETRFGDGGG